MYKLILVDDEQDVRNRIIASIQKIDSGFEVIANYDNSLDAFEGIIQLNPDLVVTDIRMPFMTGIELLKKIKESLPLIKSIIITGFDEFDYARQAIDLGVSGFLTKPITMTDLEEVLRKAKEDLDEEFQRNTNLENMENFIKESLPLIKENNLQRLISLSNPEKKFLKKLEGNGIFLNYKYHLVTVMDMDLDLENTNIEKYEMNFLAVKKFIDEGLQNYFYHETFTKNDEIVTIIKSNDAITMKQVEHCFEYVLMKTKKFLEFTISVGISNSSTHKNFKEMYREAQSALELRSIMGGNEIYFVSNIDSNYRKVRMIDDDELKELSYAIKYRTGSETKALLMSLKEKIAKPEYIIYNPFNLSNILNSIVKSCDDLDIFYGESKMSFYERLFEMKTLDETFNWFESLIGKIKTINQNTIADSIQRNLNKITNYIDSHYTDNDLSLEFLSDKVNISISYISAILKKEQNTTFVKYVTYLRMEKAKELLQNPNMKIVDVAEAVGYSEPYYFSHSFKKYQGVSPKEYRTSESTEK
ncbi:MAG TPA: response regulator [Bacilli bacterium]|nr:response regulator [Bacilli bacterium]